MRKANPSSWNTSDSGRIRRTPRWELNQSDQGKKEKTQEGKPGEKAITGLTTKLTPFVFICYIYNNVV